MPSRRGRGRSVAAFAGALVLLSLAGAAITGGWDTDGLAHQRLAARPALLTGTPTPLIAPVRLRGAEADVDAVIQALDTPADVVSSNVGGPWIVVWHQETGRLGVPGNVVLGGHLDYYTSGPAVFWTLHELAPGDVIEITGDDGGIYSYEVDWVQVYALDGLTAEVTRAIVGPTPNQTVTLITEAGEFNAAASAYDSRTVVRGHRIARPATVPATPEAGDSG
ncbi:MAG: class F sortase [Chloroflexota bacterium]|nr:class F sortase [Chloroflexota bacterium]